MKIKPIFLAIFLPAFLPLSVFSQENTPTQPKSIPIQVIDNLKDIVYLNTKELSTEGDKNIPVEQYTPVASWWVTELKIDPKIETEFLISRPGPVDIHRKDWHPISIPGKINYVKEIDINKNIFWIRKTFFLKNSDQRLSKTLNLGIISDSDRVYLNGKKIASTGKWDSNQPQAYDKIRIYDIPEGVLKYGSVNVLLIQVKGLFIEEIGITSGDISIGPAGKIHKVYYNNSYREMLFLMLYFSVGSYFLFLFIRQGASRENLFFALFTYILIAYQFNRGQIKFDLGMELFDLKRIEYLMLTWLVPSFYFFIRSFLKLPKNKFTKVYDILILVFLVTPVVQTFIILFYDDVLFWDYCNKTFFLNFIAIYMILALVITFYNAYGFKISRPLGIPIVHPYIKKNIDAVFLSFGLFLFFLAALFDTVAFQMGLAIPRVLGYAFIVFVLSIALILANRFVRLHNEVEDLNKNLEAKVEERTEELNNTLSEVRALKVQQDGDYFLTSLLIHPLGGNYSNSELVDIKMMAHQKKKFFFKEKESEIGGDINVAHDITLRGRKYTIVLNADAMGKSIQGAGGALVLGTVFKSLVSRTKLSSTLQKRFPEQWLKLSFSELQDVFVSFDGSMLISLVLGLIDQENGMFYYINAEHPFVALYRDGKASFIGREHVLRKVGIDLFNEGLSIQTLPLMAGDVLYLGSDGRDDVLLGDDASGNRIINEDEEKFLEHIETGKGILSAVEKAILDSGDITDDFTLIRIGYREDAPFPDSYQNPQAEDIVSQANSLFRNGEQKKALELAIQGLEQHKNNPAILRQIIRMMIVQKNNKDIIPYIAAFSKLGAEDQEFLYYASYVYKNARKFELAADFGERCRMRDPGHLNNIANLVDIYRLNGNIKRANRLLDRALEMDPEHELLQKVAQNMKTKASA